MRHLYITLFCLLNIIGPFKSMAQEDYILIISSYTNDYPWSKAIEESFRKNLKAHHVNMEVYSEYLNTNLIPSSNNWFPRMEVILNSYTPHLPKLVILLADNAWMAYRKMSYDQWKKINILLAGIKEHSLDFEHYQNKKSLHPDDFIPNKILCREYNATGITEKLQIEATFQLMSKLQPELKDIAVISDRQFYGIYSLLQIQKFIKETNSKLKLIPLDGRFITTDSLYKCLATLSPHTGILLACWAQDKNTQLLNRNHIYQNICAIANRPIFVLNDWGIDNDKFMGGYYSCSNDYGDELTELTLSILQGTQAQDIPLTSNLRGLEIHLNQTQLHQFGLDTSDLSSNVIHYYAPLPTFWKKYASLFLSGSILILLGGILYLIIFTSSRFTFYRKKIDSTQNEIHASLNNQQHLADALRYFLDTPNEKDSVNKILQRMLEELEADRAYIFEFDEIHHTSSNTYEICSPLAIPQIDTLQNIPNDIIPWLYSRMQEDKLLIIEDLRTTHDIIEESERKILLEQGIISMLVAPLHVNNKLWGYVGVDYVHEKRHWDKQDTVYLSTLSRILCIGIEHFRSEKRNTLSQQKVAELEALFSFASEQANVGFAQWNPLKNEGFATDQWFINLGETTREIKEVINIYQYMHPEDRKELNQFTSKAGKGEALSFIKNIRIQQNNEWHWYKYHATLKNYDFVNQEAELVFLSVDIDTLKKTEASLTAAKAKAEESDKLKSAFLANMSHEIRTPLNAIVGFSNILTEGNKLTPEERAEYMQIISTNNQLLLQLINDILDISKIEAGVMDFTEDIVELNLFCQEIKAIYVLRAKPHVHIKFIQNHPEEYALNIDRTRLNQVISNFLNNALKFTTQGHIYFGFEIREKDIFFYVEDTGIGIEADKQSNIFQRFVKLNTFAQGTGLGLSICSTIIEKYKGEIGVNSQPGQGSTFWFTIPRKDI